VIHSLAADTQMGLRHLAGSHDRSDMYADDDNAENIDEMWQRYVAADHEALVKRPQQLSAAQDCWVEPNPRTDPTNPRVLHIVPSPSAMWGSGGGCAHPAA
jgi:hypothetical protein